jgi:hypothetical protein
MSTTSLVKADDGKLALPGGSVVELPLLLPDWQAVALEEAAHSRGLTAGQMVRGLIQEFFGKFVQPSQLPRHRGEETAGECDYRRELLGGTFTPEAPLPGELPDTL